jgi:hypothetical protein
VRVPHAAAAHGVRGVASVVAERRLHCVDLALLGGSMATILAPYGAGSLLQERSHPATGHHDEETPKLQAA